MATTTKSQVASKNAKQDVKSENPLSSKVVKGDPKKDAPKPEPKADPEKEKKIADAKKAVADAELTFTDAKTKLADAKKALRALTGGKKGEPKGPGVIETILSLVTKSGKKGISKADILTKLTETFPDRATEGMEKTINVQLPGRMSKEKKIKIEKLENGNFYVAQ